MHIMNHLLQTEPWKVTYRGWSGSLPVGVLGFLLLVPCFCTPNYNKISDSSHSSIILCDSQVHVFYRDTAFMLSRSQCLKYHYPNIYTVSQQKVWKGD